MLKFGQSRTQIKSYMSFGLFNKKQPAPTPKKEETETGDHYHDLGKRIAEMGVREYCLDFLNLTESDLERLQQKVEVDTKGSSLQSDLSDVLPHVNEAFRKNANRYFPRISRTSEASLKKRIRQIVSSDNALESRGGIRELLVAVTCLLKKRFS